MQQVALEFDTGLAADIDLIHSRTSIYTVPEECLALLDALGWPACGSDLLDPGAGNGAMVVAALSRLQLGEDDVAQAVRRVRGFEFHPGAAASARRHVAHHLLGRGWSPASAQAAAIQIIEVRDFLLSPVEVGRWTSAVSNAPYLRWTGLPPTYRAEFERHVEKHARGDLLFAYLQRLADVIDPRGSIGAIVSDRVLFNASSAELRRRLGARYAVRDARRLDAASAFYRPKSRRANTPPRVHPVSLVLDPSGVGRPLSAEPFHLSHAPPVTGIPLAQLARIQLAPWLGPEGIFVVRNRSSFPPEALVPVAAPDDILPLEDRLRPSSRWALVTHPQQEPHPSVLAHLDRELPRMSPRGRRAVRWLPPESFAHRLPLAVDAIMVPRIARRLRAIPLAAGVLPIDHGLVVVSGRRPDQVAEWLNHPAVQAQANALAPRLENGFMSLTATLLRALVVPTTLGAGDGGDCRQ